MCLPFLNIFVWYDVLLRGWCVYVGYASVSGIRYLYSCCHMTGVVQCLKLALSKGPNRVGVSSSSPDLSMETGSVSETLCFLVFRIPEDRQSPDAQQCPRFFFSPRHIDRGHTQPPIQLVPAPIPRGKAGREADHSLTFN
jgi:hypothetical protein